MEKSLPADINAERATLGSILLDRDAVIPVAPWLFAEYFYVEKHAWIYEAQLACYNRRVPPDLVNVTDELRRRERLDAIGGVSYLIELSNSVPTAVHIEYYGRIVERTALMRRLIVAGGKIAGFGYDETEDLEATLDKAETELFAVSQRRATEGFVHIGQVVDTFFDHINQMQEHGGELVGLPTGFVDFDKLTGGLQRSDLLILAARPAVGKCLAWWTLIDDPETGERRTIQECVKHQLSRVYGISQAGQVRPTAISDWIDSGIQPCYRVRTRTGRTVDVTAKHPFLTAHGWTPISQIAVGEAIAVPRCVPVFGTDESWSLEQIHQLAALLADGDLPASSPDFRSSMSGSQSVQMTHPSLVPVRQGTIRLKAGGIGKPGSDQGLPDEVWRWSKWRLAEFLRVLIGCDGSISAGPAGLLPIDLAVGSQKLALDVQHALLRFGCLTTCSQPTATSWRIKMTDPASIRRYQTEIGEIGKKAPGKISWTTPGRYTPRSDLYWDEIVEISPIGDHQVYDLTVPDGANFIAQDMCVHNTSFALNIAYNAAMDQGSCVAIFSLEMSRDQLMQRILATHTGIDMQKLRTGQIRDSEMQTITEALGVLSTLQIYIDDTPSVSSMDVRSKCRRLQAETGIDLVIVDYLQLMQGNNSKRDGNRVQEISEISRGLKALAREVNVPVLALSQLSRAVESRTSHIPMLSDLRESGCITGDSLIYLPDEGIYRRIDELVGHIGFNVLAINTETWKLEKRQVINSFCTGVKPVYKMITKLGRVIRATANHKFLTIEGWTRLDELEPGTHLALPRQLPGPTEQTMTNDELALLGHLLGDGCTLARQCIHYTTADLDVAEIVADLARKVFGDTIQPRIQRELEWYQVYLAATQHLTHGVRNPVAAWLDGMGAFNLRSYEKRVPECVFQQPVEAIAHFMRHLWATDGCIWTQSSDKKKNHPSIYYASSSEGLARDVQSLLLRLNLTAILYRVPQKNKERDQLHVDIGGKIDMEEFIKIVDAVGQRKQASLQALANCLDQYQANTNRDIIPRAIWRNLAVPAMQAVGLTTRQMQALLGNAYCGTGLYKQNVSRARALRLSNVVSSDTIKNLAQSDVYWDQIKSIELDGEAQVYDLTVEGLHNFVADNIIIKNSIEQDADIVMFIYREELYDPETDKKGIAELHLAKHRNGPTGVVPMRFFKATTRFANLETYRQIDGY